MLNVLYLLKWSIFLRQDPDEQARVPRVWSFIQAQETLKLPPEARVWQGAPVLLSTLPL